MAIRPHQVRVAVAPIMEHPFPGRIRAIASSSHSRRARTLFALVGGLLKVERPTEFENIPIRSSQSSRKAKSRDAPQRLSGVRVWVVLPRSAAGWQTGPLAARRLPRLPPSQPLPAKIVQYPAASDPVAISLTAYPTSRRHPPEASRGAAQPPPCEPSDLRGGSSKYGVRKTQSPALTSEGDRDRLLPRLLAVARSNIASYT